MRRTGIWQRAVSGTLAAGLVVSVTACGGGKSASTVEPGTANNDASQTDFTVMGGMSALSKGYENNEVLNQLQSDAGVKIAWNCMSDSLAEQVNIKATTEEGLGFTGEKRGIKAVAVVSAVIESGEDGPSGAGDLTCGC